MQQVRGRRLFACTMLVSNYGWKFPSHDKKLIGTKHIVRWTWVMTAWSWSIHAIRAISVHNSGGMAMAPSLGGKKMLTVKPSVERIEYVHHSIDFTGENESYPAVSINDDLWQRLLTENSTFDTMPDSAVYQDLPETYFFYWICNTAKRVLVDVVSGTSLGPLLHPSCYAGVGCFNYYENMSLKLGPPNSPEEVLATFYFFHKSSGRDLQDILTGKKTVPYPEKTWTLQNWSYSKMSEPISKGRPLIVVTHGYKGSKRTPWMLPLVKALLKNVNCTVLVVDWEKGASGYYRNAAVNSPMAGVLISLFLQKIITDAEPAVIPNHITLIGHSLGAQVMGFAGRHFQKSTGMLLGRISALDPAGYLFENDTVCLSRSDAKYVDVIHTDAGEIENLHFGLRKQVGHVDFYPNNGSLQPGCSGLPDLFNVVDYVACSHSRAPHFYIESLTNCKRSFTSYNCPDWESYLNGSCRKAIQPNKRGLMGYYSFTERGRGTQYLATNEKSPFCRGNRDPPKGKGSAMSPQSLLALFCNK